MATTNEYSFQLDDNKQIQYLENDINSVDYELEPTVNPLGVNSNSNRVMPNKNGLSVLSSNNNHLNLLGY